LLSFYFKKKFVKNKKRYKLPGRPGFKLRRRIKYLRKNVCRLFTVPIRRFKKLYIYKNPRRYLKKIFIKYKSKQIHVRKEYLNFLKFNKNSLISLFNDFLSFFKPKLAYGGQKINKIHFSFYLLSLNFFTTYLTNTLQNTQIFINKQQLKYKKKSFYILLLTKYMFLLRKIFSTIYFFKTLKTTPELSAAK
jgi:hypothetical protein